MQKYQSLLIEEQTRLQDLIKKTHAHLHHTNGPISQDFADQATETENDEVVAALNREAQQELKQVEAALRRIDNEVFGICVQCGRLIQQARLEALPYTPLCIDCAQTS